MDDNIDPKKLPKKRKSRAKDTAPIPTPTPIKELKITPLSAAENEMFLKQINNYLKKKEEVAKVTRENITDFRILQSNVGEFLESFIVFGYTYEGERVLIQNWPSARDKDALLEFLKNVFILNTSRESEDHD